MNLSLDDIIRKTKLKRGVNTRLFNQNTKTNRKISLTTSKGFKPDLRKVRQGRVRDSTRFEKIRVIGGKFDPARKRSLSLSQVGNINRKNNIRRKNIGGLKNVSKVNIEDARLKIGRKNLRTAISTNKLLPTAIPKPADARFRIEARKSEKDRQMNVILPATSPSLKGILRHSVKNTYIDRDYVPDEDNDIDFSIKTHVRTINNYADDVPMEDTDLLGVNVYVNDDVIVDEDTDPGIAYTGDLHLLRRTITNDQRRILNQPILVHGRNISSPAMVISPPIMKENNLKYSEVTRTIENINRPTKLLPLTSKSAGARDVANSARTLEHSKPSMNSRLGKKTSEIDGYKLIVSNLHVNVTSEDIKELFEDVGSLISAKVTRPGTAEVVYKLQEEALKAVDVYHNRQLDGQPMKCVLIKHSPSIRESFPSKKNSRASSIQPDPNTIRKALFN